MTRALRKLVLVTALVSLLLVGTVCAQIPTLLKYLEGGVIASVVRSPTHAADPYPATNALVNQGALATIIWYAWTDPDPAAWLTARDRPKARRGGLACGCTFPRVGARQGAPFT